MQGSNTTVAIRLVSLPDGKAFQMQGSNTWKNKLITITTNTNMITKEDLEREKCILELDAKIKKVVADNPNITTKEVVRRNQVRLSNYRKKTTDAIYSAFTEAVSLFREDFKVKLKPNSPAEQLSIWSQK